MYSGAVASTGVYADHQEPIVLRGGRSTVRWDDAAGYVFVTYANGIIIKTFKSVVSKRMQEFSW